MATTEKFSAKEAAIQLGTDARTLRKFIRSKSCDFEPVGQGNRYEFTSKEIKSLKKAFLAWSNGTKPKKEKEVPTIEELNEALEEGPLSEDEIDEVLEVEVEDQDPDADVDEDEIAFLEGPSDEDLEEIDIEDLDD